MRTQDWYVRKTRACAKKLSQKVLFRSSSGTDSMHLAQQECSTQSGLISCWATSKPCCAPNAEKLTGLGIVSPMYKSYLMWRPARCYG